jgi:serine/threonine protein kinase
MLDSGTILQHGNYKILGYLDSGGCADLYTGLDIRRNQKVAIKVFRNKEFDELEEVKSFYHRETAFIDIQANYSPYTLKLIDSFIEQQNNSYYIITNLINGLDFEKWYEDWILTKPKNMYHYLIKNIFYPLSDYLAYVHCHGIMHRDFSPSNLLISKVNSKIIPTVIDWGGSTNFDPALISKVPDLLEKMDVCDEYQVYTLGYEPPELNLGVKLVPQSDIYCFGVILYYALTKGKYRKRNRAHSSYTLKPKKINWRCPELLSHIVEKCTQYEPKDRYLTFTELKQDLALYLKKAKKSKK